MAKILKSSLVYNGPSSENLIEFIQNGLQKNASETILIDSKSGTKWNGKELEEVVCRVAKFLLDDCGLKKGEVCSLYGEERDWVTIMILAVISAGGVSNFLTNKSSGREVHDTAKVLNSKLLFTTSECLNTIRPDLRDIEDRIQTFCVDACCSSQANYCKSINDLLSKGTTSVNFEYFLNRTEISPLTDYAVIQFSSGTTGKPKPIPRTHSNLSHLVASVDHPELMDLRPGVVIAGSLPISHRPGLWALLASVATGSTFVIWSNLSDVEDALVTIQNYRVTIFSSSLPFLSMLGNVGLQIKDRFDTSTLKHIITSGAKIVNPDLPKRLVEGFNLTSLRQCFGMTESGWCFLIELSNAKDNYLTVGHVVPGMEAVVMSREVDDQLLRSGERGEIALRGPQVFRGYLKGSKLDDLNRSDFTPDGWFRIGDRGFYDGDELVFIEGRYKEVMMFENNTLHFPSEIEALISEHQSVEGVCVVKIAESRQDYPYDIARAYVTLRIDRPLTEEELVNFVKEKSPSVILEGGVRFLDKFPRLANGKVDKQSLKAMQ